MIENKGFVDKFYSGYKNVKNIFDLEIIEAPSASDSTYTFLFGLNRVDLYSMKDIIFAELVDEEYNEYEVYAISPIDKAFVRIGTQVGSDFFFNN